MVYTTALFSDAQFVMRSHTEEVDEEMDEVSTEAAELAGTDALAMIEKEEEAQVREGY